jgi:hypothetical protein
MTKENGMPREALVYAPTASTKRESMSGWGRSQPLSGLFQESCRLNRSFSSSRVLPSSRG